MAKICKRNENYSQWYMDIITEAQLFDYGPNKGSMIIRPRGYAIWESMQTHLDAMLKDTGHVNAYFPLFIPEHFFQKEANHIKGFSPELAIVTHAGGEVLEEPLAVRPTSETIIWNSYKNWIQSYRDLPLLLNQWANVVRWEKRTRPFLRTSEFLWQEGHTAHATQAEAETEAQLIHTIYTRFVEDYLAIPVLCGKKSESEKFAGAIDTYTVEAMMQDTRALQTGTSHFLGQNFSRAFDVQFQTETGELEYVWASSWGVSTRLIGALIMTHSDDKGLIIPPRIAPQKIVIIPIFNAENKHAVLTYADTIKQQLCHDTFHHLEIHIDTDSTNRPGWRFAQWELYGVPLRIELGPKDMAHDTVVCVRRDTGEKMTVATTNLPLYARETLEAMHHALFMKAKIFMDKNTHYVDSYDDFIQLFNTNSGGGFVIAPWDGTHATEQAIKNETKATTRLLLPHDTHPVTHKTCIYSKAPAAHMAVFAKSY